MRLRPSLPGVLLTLMMTISACGVFGSGGEVSEDVPSRDSMAGTVESTEGTAGSTAGLVGSTVGTVGTVGSTAGMVGSTVVTDGPTGEDSAQPTSYLKGGKEPPPGLEDQIGMTISSMMTCFGSLNGPGGHGVFQIPPSAMARLMLGDVLYDDVVVRVEIDPTVMERLADLAPIIEFTEVPLPRDPPGLVTTIDPSVLDTIGTTSAPSIGALDPDILRLPGVTLAPSSTAETISELPPATIPVVSQTEKIFFCGTGWSNSSFLQTTIAGPGGTVLAGRLEQAGDTGTVGVSWTPGLEHPIGRYNITVTDGAFTAEAALDVVSPTSSTIDVLGAETVRSGDVVKIGFVAFQPGAMVSLHVFVEDELQAWRYTGTVRDVEIGELGSTVYELQTLPNDPEGIYCVLLAGTSLSKCRDVAFEVSTG